jgi:hypothetical protein
VVVGSGTVRRPEQATYVRTAGVEGVTRGARAARRPCEPSRLCLFALMTVARQASCIYPHAGGTRPAIRLQVPLDVLEHVAEAFVA